MARNKKQRERIEEEKKSLFEELKNNIKVRERNETKYETQVQVGLYQKGLPVGAPMYNSLLDMKKMEIKECNIKLENGFEPISPDYKYQQSPEWIDLMKEFTKKKLEALKKDLEEIESNVAEVEAAISKQNETIDYRNLLLIERLKEIGMTQEEIDAELQKVDKDTNYIR